MSIEEYILLSKEERQKHLDLNESCKEIGGNSTQFRGLLAYMLGTTIPKGKKIVLCHACNNSKCCNHKHLYWGTAKENHIDSVLAGTHKSIYQRTVDKYGLEAALQMAKDAAIKSTQK